eukprot:3639496-Pyramimonas_sp.AAC.1
MTLPDRSADRRGGGALVHAMVCAALFGGTAPHSEPDLRAGPHQGGGRAGGAPLHGCCLYHPGGGTQNTDVNAPTSRKRQAGKRIMLS